jgi:hypothetical protein
MVVGATMRTTAGSQDQFRTSCLMTSGARIDVVGGDT